MSRAAYAGCRRPAAAPAKANAGPGIRLDPAPGTACAPDRGIDLAHIPSAPIRISNPAEAAEREADRAADKVMRGEQAQLAAAAPMVARKCAACEAAEAPVPPAVAAALEAPGQPLDPAVRADFEPRFGTSFADVRVHPDSLAARSIDASAFTLGRDIALAPGEYEPGTPAGRHLLAHELAHVAQQAGGGGPGVVHRQPYHTARVEMGSQNLRNMAGASYWLQKTLEHYDFTQSQRMANAPEEQEAALAALWAANPLATVPSGGTLPVTVKLPPAPGGAARPALIYQFQFKPVQGGKIQLADQFVRNATDRDPAPVPLPADYRSRTSWDLELDKLRADPNPADRLGTVTLPTSLPIAEREAIGYAIWGYFGTGKARNTEVDAVIPLAAAGRSLMVTMRFGANNNVVVERIGEAGTGRRQVDVNRIDISRVNGFPGATAGDAMLRDWWSKRYPAGGALKPAPAPPAAPAPAGGPAPAPAAPGNAALIAEMNGLIAKGVASAAWFQGNYQLEVMAAGPAQTLLSSFDPAPERAHLVADTRNFTAAELVSLEIALQLLGDGELKHLSGVKIARKKAAIDMIAGQWQATQADGVAFQPGTTRIILYFDSIKNSDPWLFRGGAAATALPASAMPTVHEFGHIIGDQAGILAAFNAWELKNPQIPPTDYARTRGKELFAEFYALFRTDPRFLCSTAPLAFAWFVELVKTGKPPPATVSLTAPGRCPP